MDETVTLSAFFKCLCGKMHTRDYIRHDSVCVCGRDLGPRRFE